MNASDVGSHAAAAHLLVLVTRWAGTTGSVVAVRVSRVPIEGVRCFLDLTDEATVTFDFVFTAGVETGDADDGILDELNAAWAEEWIDDCEIFVSGLLDEWSVRGRQQSDAPTNDSDS